MQTCRSERRVLTVARTSENSPDSVACFHHPELYLHGQSKLRSLSGPLRVRFRLGGPELNHASLGSSRRGS